MKQYALTAAGVTPRFVHYNGPMQPPEVEVWTREVYTWCSILRPVFFSVSVPWDRPYTKQTDDGIVTVHPSYAMPVVQGIMALDFDPMRVNGAN
jgi:hypothetical protein